MRFTRKLLEVLVDVILFYDGKDHFKQELLLYPQASFRESYRPRYHQLKFDIVSKLLQFNKNKTLPLIKPVVRFKFCKNSDISIIISMNENIQMSNKSTVNKKCRRHHPTRMDVHIGNTYICFQIKKSCDHA